MSNIITLDDLKTYTNKLITKLDNRYSSGGEGANSNTNNDYVLKEEVEYLDLYDLITNTILCYSDNEIYTIILNTYLGSPLPTGIIKTIKTSKSRIFYSFKIQIPFNSFIIHVKDIQNGHIYTNGGPIFYISNNRNFFKPLFSSHNNRYYLTAFVTRKMVGAGDCYIETPTIPITLILDEDNLYIADSSLNKIFFSEYADSTEHEDIDLNFMCHCELNTYEELSY